MRVLISVDLEGIAGVVHPADTMLEGIEYERARRWMTAEANAAIEGAFAGGAIEVVVNDSHGHMRNLLVDELHPASTLIRGALKPLCMLQGLGVPGDLGGPNGPQTDAVLLVGYHAMAGTGTGILNHTFSGGAIYRLSLNGLAVGEVGFNAAVAGSLGAPVVLVSGDSILRQEVQALLPWAESVVVKQSITSWASESLSPRNSQDLIRAGAERALRRLPEMRPLQLTSPIRMEVELFRPAFADYISIIPGVERVNGTTVSFTAEDMLTINRAWVTMLNVIPMARHPYGYG